MRRTLTPNTRISEIVDDIEIGCAKTYYINGARLVIRREKGIIPTE